MSWELAADWLAVAGTAIVTLGTGAQALDNLAEFKSEAKLIGDEAKGTLKIFSKLPILVLVLIFALAAEGVLAVWFLVSLGRRLWALSTGGDDKAAQLKRFLRLAAIWYYLMIGSGLAMGAAIIQLVHA